MVQDARRFPDGVALMNLDGAVCAAAAAAEPAGLRTLDAVHLASAPTLAGDAELGFACYDEPLAAAAEAAGLQVLAPA